MQALLLMTFSSNNSLLMLVDMVNKLYYIAVKCNESKYVVRVPIYLATGCLQPACF